MRQFKEFFKTKVGMKKKADDPSMGAAASMRAAFGATSEPATAPAPATPADSGGSLGSRITAGLSSMIGNGG